MFTRRGRMPAGLVGACALAASLAFVRDAPADDRAAAQALFDAAKALAGESKFAEACPKFEASYKLDRTLGTLLNLADCHEKIGRVASAWAEFEEAADRAARAADNRADYAKQRRDALSSRLPKLNIAVPKPVASLSVMRDDVKVEEATYGVALPIDPGKHAVAVKRGDQVLKQESVETAEGATATVTLDLEAIDKANPPPPTPTATATSTAPPPPPPPSSQKLVGFIVGGVGVAAIAGAAVLEIVAISKKPGASDCVNQFCTPSGIQAADDARTFANVGQWLGIGGIAAAAIGVTLILTAPSAPKQAGATDPPRRAYVRPWVGPGGGGLSLGGHL